MSNDPVGSRHLERSAGYEPPKVTPLGNVRDLLAGSSGTQDDQDPDQETRPPLPTP